MVLPISNPAYIIETTNKNLYPADLTKGAGPVQMTQKMLRKLLAAGCLLVMGIFTHSAAFAGDCDEPAWVKLLELRKKSDELIAAASGPTAAKAFVAAKRKISERFVDQYASELFRLPQVKGKLNTKAYVRDDYLPALRLAVAFNIKNPKRLEFEPRCELVYIALMVQRKELIAQLRGQEDFAEHINLAMTGKLDQREAAEFLKDNDAIQPEFADADSVTKNLIDLGKTLDGSDFLEREMIQLIKIGISDLKNASENARSITFKEDRSKELAKIKSSISDAGKIYTAVKDFKRSEYISAIEIFQKCGHDGAPICQFISGVMHLRALGTKKSPAEGLKWLKKAALSDHTVSKLFIGIYTFAGIGTNHDPDLAAKWVNEAFQQGWTCDIEIKSCNKGK